jgi:hypothetical protein
LSLRGRSLLCLGLGGCLFLGLDLLLQLDQLAFVVEDLVRLGTQFLHVHLALPELVQETLAQLIHHLAPLFTQGVYL